MARKKWTPKAEITEELLRFREKRKWQLALRRYVLEKNKSSAYAQYFGLSIEDFRKWIELQFTKGLNWENFGTAWQFDHIVPVTYFDFSKENDLRLCWNFINIRVEKTAPGDNTANNRIDIIAARPYFEGLYKKTKHEQCLRMIDKIASFESLAIVNELAIEEFIIQNRRQIELIASFSSEEFRLLNMGKSVDDILLEQEIIKKFG